MILDPSLARLVFAGVVPNLAYLAIGMACAAAFGVAARGAERLAISYAVGTGVASLAILVLRAWDLPVSVAGLGVVGLASLVWLSRRPRVQAAATGTAPPRWVAAVDAASAALAATLFVSALGPEVGWDSLEYHLPIAKAWSEGPIRALPGVLDAELRNGVDLLALPAVAAGSVDAAATVSACFAACLAALCRARVAEVCSQGAAAVTGLVVITTPLVAAAAVTSEVDLAVGVYGLLALAAADRWNRGGDASNLLVCAIALAFAANAKLHAAILVPAAVALLCFGGRVPDRAAWLRGAGVSFALACPWLVKAWLTTGNPLFPLFAEWLGSGWANPLVVSARQTTLLQAFPVSVSPAGFASWSWFVVFGREAPFAGELGLLPFLLAPFAWRRPDRPTAALLCVCAALLLLQFGFMRFVRFGTPLWPWLGVGAAVGGARLARTHPAMRVVVATGVAAACAFAAIAVARDSMPRIAAIANPDAFRARSWPDQLPLRELVEVAEPTVGISMGAALWMPAPVYNLHWERNGEFFFRGTDPDETLRILKRRGVNSLVVAVNAPLPPGGRSGHPTVDHWIAQDAARVRSDVPPRPKRAGRVWVLVELE